MTMTTQEAGKLGSNKRWAPKYEMLVELSKYAENKDELDRLSKLKIKTLAWIIKTIEYIKNDKRG